MRLELESLEGSATFEWACELNLLALLGDVCDVFAVSARDLGRLPVAELAIEEGELAQTGLRLHIDGRFDECLLAERTLHLWRWQPKRQCVVVATVLLSPCRFECLLCLFDAQFAEVVATSRAGHGRQP